MKKQKKISKKRALAEEIQELEPEARESLGLCCPQIEQYKVPISSKMAHRQSQEQMNEK